jgi:hypothetical protein
MNYDVYHGAKKDFEESDGKRICKNVSILFLGWFLEEESEPALNGELIPIDRVKLGVEFGKEGVIWIEEAM